MCGYFPEYNPSEDALISFCPNSHGPSAEEEAGGGNRKRKKKRREEIEKRDKEREMRGRESTRREGYWK